MTYDVETIRDLARQAQPHQQLTENVVTVPDREGGTKVIDLRDLETTPRVKEGARTVRDIRSFLTYLEKHLDEAQTEVWADEPGSKVVAVLDAHRQNGAAAGTQRHTITLELVHTPEWKTWMNANGKRFKQAEFAEFLEANAADIIQPNAATFLEVAQTLLGSTEADWVSAHRLTDGQVQLSYKETVTARAGQMGDLTIPTDFTIAVRPYLGGHRYSVKAHFRYRIVGTDVVMFFQLDRPEATLESAFRDTVQGLQYGLAEESIDLDGPNGAGEKIIDQPEVRGVGPILMGLPGNTRS